MCASQVLGALGLGQAASSRMADGDSIKVQAGSAICTTVWNASTQSWTPHSGRQVTQPAAKLTRLQLTAESRLPASQQDFSCVVLDVAAQLQEGHQLAGSTVPADQAMHEAAGPETRQHVLIMMQAHGQYLPVRLLELASNGTTAKVSTAGSLCCATSCLGLMLQCA